MVCGLGCVAQACCPSLLVLSCELPQQCVRVEQLVACRAYGFAPTFSIHVSAVGCCATRLDGSAGSSMQPIVVIINITKNNTTPIIASAHLLACRDSIHMVDVI